MNETTTVELLPCWICHKPCTTGECATCYATPDSDIVIEIDEDTDDGDTANTDET